MLYRAKFLNHYAIRIGEVTGKEFIYPQLLSLEEWVSYWSKASEENSSIGGVVYLRDETNKVFYCLVVRAYGQQGRVDVQEWTKD